MKSFLAFPVYLDSPAAVQSGARGEHIVAMDLFVLINLGFLLFMLGFIACMAWVIWRRTTNPPPHIRLIMELDEEESKQPQSTHDTPEEQPRAAWERESDWWRK